MIRDFRIFEGLKTITLRGVTARNRIVISPMCQYSADDGVANDWHLVHLGKFAQGGAGIVMTEATAVNAAGRITHGDLGLWKDDQIAPLKRITAFLRANDAVPAIQLAHAGRKASMQRPWFGNAALNAEDRARGDLPWAIVAPSAIAMDEGWLLPHELTAPELKSLLEDFRRATLRAVSAGFDVIELHCAHGYLLHEFLSPLSNKRSDAYGGDRAGRMKFPLEVIETVRAAHRRSPSATQVSPPTTGGPMSTVIGPSGPSSNRSTLRPPRVATGSGSSYRAPARVTR